MLLLNFGLSRNPPSVACVLCVLAVLLSAGCKNQTANSDKIHEVGTQNEYSHQIRLKAINQQIAESPSNPLAYAKRAELFLETGDNTSALQDAKMATALDTAQGEYQALLARCYRKSKRLDSAAMAIGHAKRLGYASPSLYISSAEILLIARRYEGALEEINKAISLAPSNAEAYFYKGYIYEEQGDTGKAISSYTTAIEQNSSFVDAYNKLATLYLSHRQYALAYQYLKSGLRFAPQDAYLNYNLGIYYLDRNQGDTAETYLQKALFYDNTLYLASLNLGLRRYKERKYLESANLLETSLQANQNQPSARFYLALCRENSGNLADALAQYEAVINLNQGYVQDAEKGIKRIKARNAAEADADLDDTASAL